MGSLFQLIFVSTATEDFDRPKLVELLNTSVSRNQKRGITGLLLFKDGCFMQVIEGEEEQVKFLFSKISVDHRHHKVIVLLQGPINDRSFPNSAMAFRNLNSPEIRQMPGYSEFLNTPLDGELLRHDIPHCKRLLLIFKKNIR